VVAQYGNLVGDDPPQWFDKPAGLPQCIKQLAAGIAHLKGELDKIKNGNLSQGAGALNEIRRPDYPPEPGDAQVLAIFLAFFYHQVDYRNILMEAK
jgi:hypothetical protein